VYSFVVRLCCWVGLLLGLRYEGGDRTFCTVLEKLGKMKIKNLLLFGSLTATLVTLSETVLATTISVQLPYNKFGHVWNTDNGTSTGAGVGYCAPTATVNSFKFLENMYPNVYDNKLTKGDIIKTRNDLVGLMGTCPDTGTQPQNWWQGKIQWIEDNAPGRTSYGGMVMPSIDVSTWNKKDLLSNTFPAFNWLFQQLKDGEDVELGIYGSFGGHALTLTSLKFVDSMDGSSFQNGIWDPSVELAQIDYLDPNNPTQLFWSDLSLNPDGSLGFLWNNGGANPPKNAYIGLAFKESPIPEPSSILGLLALGTLGAASTLKRKLKPSKSTEKEMTKVG